MLKASIVALAIAAAVPAWPSVVFLDATDRGWVSTGVPASNGADPGNNYLAGELLSSEYRNWFEFSIPTFSGTLASATLTLTQPQPGGHVGDDFVYSVYSLGGQPATFTDVNSSLLYGSVNTGPAGDASVTIDLDAAALAAITDDAGGDFFISGIDSAEGASNDAYDFGGTDARYRSLLILATVPEPRTAGVLFIAILGLLATRPPKLARSLGVSAARPDKQ